MRCVVGVVRLCGLCVWFVCVCGVCVGVVCVGVSVCVVWYGVRMCDVVGVFVGCV